ncbi:MAG: DEAD/DEAH box helicase [Acidimicrobiia bacterium]|nr:DEAD/DEAH box helicase [Acidimicrobiia bacterium]
MTTTATATLDPHLALSKDFAEAVRRHVDGLASDADLALLEANTRLWVRALYRLLDDVAESIDAVRASVRGHQRAVIVADLEEDYRAIDAVLTTLAGPPEAPLDNGASPEPRDTGHLELQLSWVPGRIIAWAAGPGRSAESAPDVLRRLRDTGAGTVDWSQHRPVKIGGGTRAETVSAPIESCLGWLVALGEAAEQDGIGASVSWLGLVAALAVRLAAQGRMVPQLKKVRRRYRLDEPVGDGSNGAAAARSDSATYVVRWVPALVESDVIAALAESLPGAAAAFENQRDANAFTQAALADIVDAIATDAAERLEAPAPPPVPRTKADVAETALAKLDGTPFDVPSRHAADLTRRLDQWARPVTESYDRRLRLIVQLDPPDDIGAWHLSVLSESSAGELQPVERALVIASRTRRQAVKHQMSRLERLFPELVRLGGRRRGEVILNADEAWQLMTGTGHVLQAVGYDVRVPALSRRRPKPSLRLTSVEAQETVVGARQLADVRWSAAFDDVELTAAEIRDLATQARPLVKSRGRWVELDRADLNEAAAALSERADMTRLTGADMLRHALGLEGSPLAGGTMIAGEGWAAELLSSAGHIPAELPTKPDGFNGTLRTYQADALVWLGFLEQAGLGGCLALDMGLGKTPTMLAHIYLTRGNGPSLVAAPPAVVGNWASEARRFVPGLRVVVHHGPSRTPAERVPAMVKGADLVVSTYGTAMRDLDVLEKVEWSTVVLDEAQAIKNPASETAQQLRRLDARCRVTLTGTPIENGLGDLWAIMDFCNPGLLGARNRFIAEMSRVSKQPEESPDGAAGSNGSESSNGSQALTTPPAAAMPKAAAAGEGALAALNGILVFRRTKAEPAIAAELPDRIDELDHCTMTAEQIGLYQAVLDELVARTQVEGVEAAPERKGAVLAAITALKQICNHPVNYEDDGGPLDGRSGKLARLEQIMGQVFAAGERMLIFTHFATWGERLAAHLSEQTGLDISCYHGGLARGARDRLVQSFQKGRGAGALVLSLKAGGTGLNLTAANHVVLYDRWWNPAVEDQARDRAWRIGQRNTVVCHRLVCPGTVDERVEEVVAGKRRIADMVLPKSSSVGDLNSDQLRAALGIDQDLLLVDDNGENGSHSAGGGS